MTELPLNTIICKDWIEALKTFPDKSIHCIVISPPYWGQRDYGTAKWEGGDANCDHRPAKLKSRYDYSLDTSPIQDGKRVGTDAPRYRNICPACGAKKIDAQLGLEKTVDEHIANLVAGFREAYRVLRDDGILWCNYGDAFLDGNLIGLAWRLAFALQADGWILRNDNIWAKALSFGPDACPHCGKSLSVELPDEEGLFGQVIEGEVINKKKSGSTMPESQSGTAWVRHKIKVKKGHYPRMADVLARPFDAVGNGAKKNLAQWADCPGCEKCKAHKGHILREGSGRCTRAHEYVFQFVKRMGYYYDQEGVREAMQPASQSRYSYGFGGPKNEKIKASQNPTYIVGNKEPTSGRNPRDVWWINPQPYKEAHFATFPEKLVEKCILASTSEKGVCPKCGRQWARVLESHYIKRDRPNPITKPCNERRPSGNAVAGISTTTLDWWPTCSCGVKETVPAVVLDFFMGSGTTLAVAARLGRNYVGVELKKEYIENQAKYRIAEAETGVSVREQQAGQGVLLK